MMWKSVAREDTPSHFNVTLSHTLPHIAKETVSVTDGQIFEQDRGWLQRRHVRNILSRLSVEFNSDVFKKCQRNEGITTGV